MVVDALQERHPPSAGEHDVNRRERQAVRRRHRTAVDIETGDGAQQVEGCDVDRRIDGPDDVAHGRQPGVGQQDAADRVGRSGEGGDGVRALGDEDAPLGLRALAVPESRRSR